MGISHPTLALGLRGDVAHRSRRSRVGVVVGVTMLPPWMTVGDAVWVATLVTVVLSCVWIYYDVDQVMLVERTVPGDWPNEEGR